MDKRRAIQLLAINRYLKVNEEKLCPVPVDQRPINEFQSLTKSWFFSWSLGNSYEISKRLFLSWTIILPLSIFIGSGSYQLRQDNLRLLLLSGFTSLFLPMLLIIRQWLGWNYVLSRLRSENIQYEKTDWHDGGIWYKPNEWRDRDLLIAEYDVSPVVKGLLKPLIINSSLILIGTGLYYTLFV